VDLERKGLNQRKLKIHDVPFWRANEHFKGNDTMLKSHHIQEWNEFNLKREAQMT